MNKCEDCGDTAELKVNDSYLCLGHFYSRFRSYQIGVNDKLEVVRDNDALYKFLSEEVK